MLNLSLPGFEAALPIIVATEGAGALAGAGGIMTGAAAAAGAGAGAAAGGGLSGFFSTPLSQMTIGQAMGGSLLTQGITGLIGAAMQGSQKMPGATPMPGMQEPAVMPAPDDQAAMLARRRKIAAISQRSGRESTFLSENAGDRLGAG